MKQELVIVFNDGYIHIGTIQLVGKGGYSSIYTLLNALNADSFLESSNGWIYPKHSIVKLAYLFEDDILKLKRDLKIEKII